MMLNKNDRLKKLRNIAETCYNCSLGETRHNLVFGEGNIDSYCMIIAEGPGQKEDEIGRPFVGRSGKLLRKMLTAIGMDPLKDCYITNIVLCRPPRNRAPKKDEIANCVKFLKKQIEIIQPKLLVLLGKTAIKGLCPEYKNESVENLRSMTKNPGAIMFENIPVMVTYHPSAVLRTPWRKVGAKEDFEYLQNIFKSL